MNNIKIGQLVTYNVSEYDSVEWTGGLLKLKAIVLETNGNSVTLAVKGWGNIDPYDIRYTVFHVSSNIPPNIDSFEETNN